jgi:hypothetical protein
MEVAGSFRFVSLRARSDEFVVKCLRVHPLFMHARETQTSFAASTDPRTLCAGEIVRKTSPIVRRACLPQGFI